MKAPDLVVVGNITRDLTGKGHRHGGTAFYAACAASKLGRRVAVLTSAGDDLDLAQELEGADICRLPAESTAAFRNVYTKLGRRQRLYATAGRIGPQDVPLGWKEAPLVLLGPVFHEIDPALAQSFPRALMGVIPQGWMRARAPDGTIKPIPWEEAPQILPHTHVLILSEEDLVPRNHFKEYWVAQVPVTVLTQGERGCTVYYQGQTHSVPSYPVKAKDPTGAGDVFAAAFLLHYAERKDPLAAARFANCAASFLVAGGIAGLPSRAQVEQRMEQLPISSP